VRRVEWTKRAKNSLDYFCEVIGYDSPTNDRKVRKEIVFTSRKITKNPDLFQLDEYYPDKPWEHKKIL